MTRKSGTTSACSVSTCTTWALGTPPSQLARCYMRDPDGYLIEVGQATGILEGKFAKKRPEDLPG